MKGLESITSIQDFLPDFVKALASFVSQRGVAPLEGRGLFSEGGGCWKTFGFLIFVVGMYFLPPFKIEIERRNLCVLL